MFPTQTSSTETTRQSSDAVKQASSILPYRLLDAMRGIAALWVVAVHASMPEIVTQYPALSQQPLYAISLQGALGVVMFFVISGYCIASAAANARQKPKPLSYFAIARVRRIYPPYLAALFIAIILSQLMTVMVAHGIFRNSGLGGIDFLHHRAVYYLSQLTLTQVPLHQVPILAVFWTLCYEVVFYALVAFALWLTLKSASVRPFLSCLHGLTFLALGWLLASPGTCPFPLDLWPQFGLGVLVFDVLSNPKNWIPKLLFLAALILLVTFGFLYNHVSNLGYHSTRIQSYFAAAFALLLGGLHRFDERIMNLWLTRALAWVGLFSYSLYLIHLLPLGLVSQLGKKFGLSENEYWISFLVQIAAGVSVGFVFYGMFERPFLKSRSRTADTSASAAPFVSSPPNAT